MCVQCAVYGGVESSRGHNQGSDRFGDRREGECRDSRYEVTGELSPQRGLDVHLGDLGGRAPSKGSNWSKRLGKPGVQNSRQVTEASICHH